MNACCALEDDRNLDEHVVAPEFVDRQFAPRMQAARGVVIAFDAVHHERRDAVQSLWSQGRTLADTR